MAIRLKLICHASTAAVRTAAFPADEPLDVRGRRNLAAVAPCVGPSDRYWTSPARRARETADALRPGATIEPMLRDCDTGRWSGRTLEDVQAQEPDAVAEWLRDPAAAPHGGESILDLMARVAGWLDAQHGVLGQVVAVTHAGVIRAAVIHAIEATPRSFWRIDIAPLSVARLSGNHGRWTLAGIGMLKAEGG